MAQYIDKEKLILKLRTHTDPFNLSVLWEIIDEQPTVDVVPKSEVGRIFEEIEQEINAARQSNYRVIPQIEESEALWNRVNGKIDALRGIGFFIEELEKKYTGEK